MHYGSRIFLAGSPDPAAVIFHDLPHDGQSDPAAALGRIPGRIGPVKPVEYIGQILRRNAFSVVLDLYLHKIAVVLQTDVDDSSFLVQIFDRIADDIVECSKSRIFKQMTNGVYVRMALLNRVLSND